MVRNGRGTTAAVVAAAGGLGLSLAALSLGAVPLLASLGDRASNKRKRGSPLSPSRWYASQDRDGRVGDAVADVLARVADGGVEPMLRCEVWPLLLGLRDANDTAVEQEQARRRRRERYRQLRRRCEELHEMLSGRSGAAMGASGDEPPADLGTFTETLPVIRADVPRTPFRTGAFQSHWEADRLAESASEDDLTNHSSTRRSAEPPAPTGGGGDANGELPRLEPVKSVPATHQPTWRTAQADRLTNVLQSYALLDPAVGYCQGMNEIAAHFLDAIPDESEAFWCFEKFLRGYRCHFVMGGHVGSPGGGGSGGATPGSTSKASGRDANDKRRGNKRGYPRVAPRRSANVRDRLHELGDVLRRCDPPLWKHVQLLGAQECMFAFRQIVVLMARELPPAETLYLWEALMARGDHVVTEEDEDEGEGEGEGEGEEGDGNDANDEGEFGAGDGRLFVHVVAAAFIQARNIAFGCHEFDQLLHASHHAVANKTLAAAPLLATATRLMAKGYRAPGMAFPTK